MHRKELISLNRINTSPTPKLQAASPTVTKENKPSLTPFVEKFEKIKSDTVRKHAQTLYDKIVAKSEKIGDKLYIQDLIDYKKLVKEFLDVTIKNSHAFSKDDFLDRRGRHRIFSQVKEVDRELANLTKDFLKQEVDRLSVLKKLDDIRGILLDILM